MIAGWMLYSLIVGALLAVASYAAARLCVLLRLPTRFSWLAGMLATLVLSARAWYQLHEPASLPGPVVEIPTFVAAEQVYSTVSAAAGNGWLLPAAWALTSLALLLVFVLTVISFGNLRRRATLHVIDGVIVFVTERVGPAVVGLLRPSILVPAWLLSESAERQRLAIAHEQEHRRGGDAWLLAVAWLLVTALPWNVFLWWCLLRLRLATELDCDHRVLRGGVSPRDYGTLLLDLAARSRPAPAGALPLSDTATQLERRLLAMTRKYEAPARRRVITMAAVVATLIAAACGTELPTAAVIDELDVTTGQQQAAVYGVLPQTTGLLYVVDGVIVSEATARAITPERIAAVEVVKGGAAEKLYGARAAHGVIQIRTGERRQATYSPAAPPAEVVSAGKPLLIVDGVVRADGDMSVLDRNTIESIEVIKGAAATRVYGADAAGGAIIVKTKR